MIKQSKIGVKRLVTKANEIGYFLLSSGVIIIVAGSLLISSNLGKPDVVIRQNNKIIASTVCGLTYAVDPEKATKADLQELLLQSLRICKQSIGSEYYYQNPNKILKHAVLVNKNTCIINWELNHVAVLKAFEKVCTTRVSQRKKDY